MYRRRVLLHRGPNRTQDHPPPRPPRTLAPTFGAGRSPQRIHRTRTRRNASHSNPAHPNQVISQPLSLATTPGSPDPQRRVAYPPLRSARVPRATSAVCTPDHPRRTLPRNFRASLDIGATVCLVCLVFRAASAPGVVRGYSVRTMFKFVSGVIEPVENLASVPAGVSCGKEISELKEGCRALKFEYATATSAKGEKASEWGEYAGHLAKVKYIAWNASKTKTETTVGEYTYDLKGRLRAEWNPQITCKRAGAYAIRSARRGCSLAIAVRGRGRGIYQAGASWSESVPLGLVPPARSSCWRRAISARHGEVIFCGISWVFGPEAGVLTRGSLAVSHLPSH